MQTLHSIARNSIANYGGNAIALGVGFILTPILVRSLGDAGYGIWILVGSISSYFWLLDFGLGSSVTKFVSELRSTGERDRLNQIIASSFVLLAGVGIVALIGSFIVAQLADRLFALPAEMVSDVEVMIYLTGVGLLFAFPLGVYGAVLRGYQRYDLLNLVAVVSTLVNFVLSIVVVNRGMGIVGLAVVGLVTVLLVGVGRWALSQWIDRGLVLRPWTVKLAVLREITGFSAWVFVINLATQVVYRTSPIIIATVLGVALITPYALATSLVQYLRRLVDPILAVLLPAYAELHATADPVRVRELFIQSSRIVGAVSTPMVLALVLLGKQFIVLWVGPEYEQSGMLLYLLAPPLYLSFLVGAGDKLLWAKGRVRVNSYVAIADTVLNLALSVGLSLMFGLPGVAMATLISVGLTNGCWLMPYICREAGLSVGQYLSLVGRPLLIPAFPATGLMLLLMATVGVHSYLHVALIAAAGGGAYWIMYITLYARKPVRRWLLAHSHRSSSPTQPLHEVNRA